LSSTCRRAVSSVCVPTCWPLPPERPSWRTVLRNINRIRVRLNGVPTVLWLPWSPVRLLPMPLTSCRTAANSSFSRRKRFMQAR
jgi:TypA_BipA: GTP-binding protein TypA/BipA